MQTGFAIDAEMLKAGEKVFRQEAAFVAGAESYDRLPPEDLPEIAFAGRSNVGKSSLINALTGRKNLARASNTPGRTQQINFFNLGRGLCLVDLPGYGYASASKEKVRAWNDLVQAYLETRRALKRVCLLIDARHGFKDADREAMRILDQARAPYIVVLTKADKVRTEALAALVSGMEAELAGFGFAFPAPCITSASDKRGVAELRAILGSI